MPLVFSCGLSQKTALRPWRIEFSDAQMKTSRSWENSSGSDEDAVQGFGMACFSLPDESLGRVKRQKQEAEQGV